MNWSHVFWQVPYKVCMDGWNGLGNFLYKTVFGFVFERSWKILWPALGETIYMTVLSTLLSYIIGITLGEVADESMTDRADVNGDGEINVSDVNALIDILLAS